MKKRSEYPTIITPRGVVAWAQLNEPDFEYKKEGEFHVRGRPDTSDPPMTSWSSWRPRSATSSSRRQKAELTAQKKGALAQQAQQGGGGQAEEVDRESGDETGEMLIRAGMKHHIEIKNGPKAGQSFDKVPDFFNAQGARLKTRRRSAAVRSSSSASASFPTWFPKDGEVGVSYQLEGVQILKLVSGGQRSASDYGFGAEDGDDIQDDNGGFADEGPPASAAARAPTATSNGAQVLPGRPPVRPPGPAPLAAAGSPRSTPTQATGRGLMPPSPLSWR
jgi:hypothetical protein